MWAFDSAKRSNDFSLENLIKAHDSIKEKRRLSISTFEELVSPAKVPTTAQTNDSEAVRNLKSRLYDFEFSQKALIAENTKLRHEHAQSTSTHNLKLSQKEAEISALSSHLEETKELLKSSQRTIEESRQHFKNFLSERAKECQEFGTYETLKNNFLKTKAELASLKARYEDFFLLVEENRDLKQVNSRLESRLGLLEQSKRAEPVETTVESLPPVRSCTSILAERLVAEDLKFGVEDEDFPRRIDELTKSNETLNALVNEQMYATELLRQERDNFRAILNHMDFPEDLAGGQSDNIWPSYPQISTEGVSLECLSQLNARLIAELKIRCPEVNVDDLVEDVGEERLEEERRKCREEFRSVVARLIGYEVEIAGGRVSLRMAGMEQDWRLNFEEVDGEFELVETGYSSSIGYLCDQYLRGRGWVPVFLSAHILSLHGMSSELSKFGFSI